MDLMFKPFLSSSSAILGLLELIKQIGKRPPTPSNDWVLILLSISLLLFGIVSTLNSISYFLEVVN